MTKKYWTVDRSNPGIMLFVVGFALFIFWVFVDTFHDNAIDTYNGPCFAYHSEPHGGQVVPESTSGFSLKMDSVKVRNPKKSREIEYNGKVYEVK